MVESGFEASGNRHAGILCAIGYCNVVLGYLPPRPSNAHTHTRPDTHTCTHTHPHTPTHTHMRTRAHTHSSTRIPGSRRASGVTLWARERARLGATMSLASCTVGLARGQASTSITGRRRAAGMRLGGPSEHCAPRCAVWPYSLPRERAKLWEQAGFGSDAGGERGGGVCMRERTEKRAERHHTSADPPWPTLCPRRIPGATNI